MEGNDIKLPLDKISEPFFGDCSFCLIQTENVLTFSENRRLSGIDILTGIIIRSDDSSGKCNNPS